MQLVLLTNNPRMSVPLPERIWQPLTRPGLQGLRATLTAEAPYPKQSCFFSDDSAKEVLVAARDLIHLGWKLVHHPLYGNYRPHQQPYRSILLQFCNQTNPDSASLQLIEAALGVYSADRVLDPRQVPEVMLKDCSLLDYELMRLPMEQTGWIAA